MFVMPIIARFISIMCRLFTCTYMGSILKIWVYLRLFGCNVDYDCMNGYVNVFQVSTFSLNTPFCFGLLVSWLLALCANAFLQPNSCFLAMRSPHLIFLLGVYQIFLETRIISLIVLSPHLITWEILRRSFFFTCVCYFACIVFSNFTLAFFYTNQMALHNFNL